jgi:predicted ABC-type ATPase
MRGGALAGEQLVANQTLTSPSLKGYRFHLFFLFVGAVDVTLSRIKERVLKGGHEVPEAVVRRRFDRSIRNFFREYQPLVDSWYLFDNTGTKPVPIAFKKGRRLRIMDRRMYEMLISRYGEK